MKRPCIGTVFNWTKFLAGKIFIVKDLREWLWIEIKKTQKISGDHFWMWNEKIIKIIISTYWRNLKEDMEKILVTYLWQSLFTHSATAAWGRGWSRNSIRITKLLARDGSSL